MSHVIATAGPKGEAFGAAPTAAVAVETGAAWDNEAAEAAMGLGSGDIEDAEGVGALRFRAESCKRVLIT
jgi:hypothetical protein